MEDENITFEDRLALLIPLVEQVKRDGEIKINVIADLGEARKYEGCDSLFPKHRVIETTTNDYFLASLIHTALLFSKKEIQEGRRCLLVSSLVEHEITTGIQTFFIFMSTKLNKPILTWKAFPDMKHPSIARPETILQKQGNEEGKQLKRNIKELQEETLELRKRCRNIEEENSNLKKQYLNLKNDIEYLKLDSKKLHKDEIPHIRRKLLSLDKDKETEEAKTRKMLMDNYKELLDKLTKEKDDNKTRFQQLEMELKKEREMRAKMGCILRDKLDKITPKEEGEISAVDKFLNSIPRQ